MIVNPVWTSLSVGGWCNRNCWNICTNGRTKLQLLSRLVETIVSSRTIVLWEIVVITHRTSQNPRICCKKSNKSLLVKKQTRWAMNTITKMVGGFSREKGNTTRLMFLFHFPRKLTFKFSLKILFVWAYSVDTSFISLYVDLYVRIQIKLRMWSVSTVCSCIAVCYKIS